MVAERLRSYIRENLNQGYSPLFLKEHLIHNGWSAQEVEEAIQEISRESRKSRRLQLFLGALMIVLLAILALSVLSLLHNYSSSQERCEVELSVLNHSVYEGGRLSYLTGINCSVGSESLIRLEYTISGKHGVTHKWQVERRPPASGMIGYQMERDAPSAPGRYVLNVTALSNQEAQSSSIAPFRVKEATCSDGKENQGEAGVDCGGPCAPCANCSDRVQNQGETGVDCGGPCGPCDDTSCESEDPCRRAYIVNGSCVHEPITPCCGNEVCEQEENQVTCAQDCLNRKAGSEYEDKLDQYVNQSVDRAGEYCESLSDAQRDSCLARLAHMTERKDICSRLGDRAKADFCYATFAFEGDISVCDRIHNDQLQESCENFRLNESCNQYFS